MISIGHLRLLLIHLVHRYSAVDNVMPFFVKSEGVCVSYWYSFSYLILDVFVSKLSMFTSFSHPFFHLSQATQF